MSTTTATKTTRRPKWHPTPPPPPSPKILNLPRRHHRRKQPKSAATRPPLSTAADPEHPRNYRGKLESLFDEERSFSKTVPIVLLNSGPGGFESGRRERVEECEEDGVFVEEKWRFQAEILRAECNFLRMEREFALKKLERNRVQIQRTLKSAVQTLISGRKKIYEGKSVSTVLEEEIDDLAEKLEELQRSCGVKDFEVLNCSNFDKKTNLLHRRLEKLRGSSDEKPVEEIPDIAKASLSINTRRELDDESINLGCKSNYKFSDMEMLRRKMEGLSKGMLVERMEEEYGSMLSTSANSSIASSSASSSKRIDLPDSSSSLTRQLYPEPVSQEERKCSGRCKAIVRRIVEQVRAETEQWSQMQEMLGQVRAEMEELQASRDFWEDRALDTDCEIQSLHSTAQEWKQKALAFETKANELQTEITVLEGELEKLRIEQKGEPEMTKDLASVSLGKQIEMEKRILVCRLKENHHTDEKGRKQEMGSERRRRTHRRNDGLLAVKEQRSPFRDIGNSSPLVKQNSKAVLSLHCPMHSLTPENF